MNSLSWLIYLADIIPNLGGMFVFFTVISGMSTAACAILHGMLVADGDDDQNKTKNALFIILPIFLVSLFLAVVIPSRDTILMIGASEIGENVVLSEQAQDIGGKAGTITNKSYKVLNNFLDQKLEEQTDEESN